MTRPVCCLHLAGLVLLTVGCAPPSGPADEAGSTGGASEETGASEATGTPLQCEPFAPYELDIDAQPNGLYWHRDLSTLFIADDDNNRILTRTADGAGAVFAEIPNPTGDPGNDGLGQLDIAADGTVYVPRFGFDDPTLGGVFRISPTGEVSKIEGLAPDVRRVGLDYDDASGVLYVATFSKDSEGVFVGWVAAVDPETGSETTIIDGFIKPVGILALGGKLYVGDQLGRKLYSVDLANPALTLLSDEVAALDQFTHSDSDDSFFALDFDEPNETGYVYRVDLDGSFTIAAQGAWEPRGIAFDGQSSVFVSEYDVNRIAVVPAC